MCLCVCCDLCCFRWKETRQNKKKQFSLFLVYSFDKKLQFIFICIIYFLCYIIVFICHENVFSPEVCFHNCQTLIRPRQDEVALTII